MTHLTITLNPDKTVGVSGPLGDKLLCYALLEMAKDAIREWRPPVILPAAALPENGFQLKRTL